MKCVICGSELLDKNYGGVSYKHCPNCNRCCATLSHIQKVVPFLQLADLVSVKLAGETNNLCINCGAETFATAHKGNAAKLFYFCPECGLWGFDSIETIKVIEYSKILEEKEIFFQKLGQEAKARAERESLYSDIKTLNDKLADKASFSNLLLYRILPIIIPISSERAGRKTPWTLIGLLSLNIAIFFVILAMDNPMEAMKPYLLWTEDIRHGDKLVGLISSCFLHGSFPHLFGNMYFLWLFGASVEDKIGSIRFLFLYMVVGIFAGAGLVFLDPHNIQPALGSSGAISGVMGMFLVFFPLRSIKTLIGVEIFHVPAVFYLWAWIMWQVINSLLSSSMMLSNIGWNAHVSGFLAGAIFALIVKKKKP